MSRPLSVAALLVGALLSIATSPARWGAEEAVELGTITLSTDAPSVDIDATIEADGAFTSNFASVRLVGENPSTVSADLVLLDRITGEELDRVTISGGFSDEPAAFSIGLDATAVWGEELALTLVLEGEGPVEGVLTLQAQIESFEQPEEGEELTLAVEAS